MVGILMATSAIAAGQVRGGGSVVSSSTPPSGAGRTSGPSRPTIAPAPGLPAPPWQPFGPRVAAQRRPFVGVRNPYFVLWFGYLYSSWTDDLVLTESPYSASPLPPPAEGVPTGGLQLDVQPHRAQVYVDGFYAGLVDDFRGYYRHLDLSAGLHRVDLLLSGYPVQTLDVVVTPGRTATYRGTLGSSVMRVD